MDYLLFIYTIKPFFIEERLKYNCTVLPKAIVLIFLELPESMCLDFECGAKIKMGFAAEFSNVLVIYTHIVKKPADMSLCQAHVTNFSPVRKIKDYNHKNLLLCRRSRE